MIKKLLVCTKVLFDVHGSGNWFLSEPITVRLSDFSFHLIEIHGLCVSPNKRLFIMDGEGLWNELDANDVNADKMINAIHERVAKVYHTKLKEVA